MDVESGDKSIVSSAFDGNIRQFVWSPDASAIFFSGLQGTNNNLYRLDLGNGRVEQVTEHVGSLSPSSFSKDRSMMAYVAQDWDTPPDVWAGPTTGDDGTKLTDANPWIVTDLVMGESRLCLLYTSDAADE